MRGLCSVTSVNRLHKRYTWKRLTFHTIDIASLSICTYLRSALVKDRDAKATGLSLPSGITSERKAPMPVGEATLESVTGNAGSWCVSTCSDLVTEGKLS